MNSDLPAENPNRGSRAGNVQSSRVRLEANAAGLNEEPARHRDRRSEAAMRSLGPRIPRQSMDAPNPCIHSEIEC